MTKKMSKPKISMEVEALLSALKTNRIENVKNVFTKYYEYYSYITWYGGGLGKELAKQIADSSNDIIDYLLHYKSIFISDTRNYKFRDEPEMVERAMQNNNIYLLQKLASLGADITRLPLEIAQLTEDPYRFIESYLDIGLQHNSYEAVDFMLKHISSDKLFKMLTAGILNPDLGEKQKIELFKQKLNYLLDTRSDLFKKDNNSYKQYIPDLLTHRYFIALPYGTRQEYIQKFISLGIDMNLKNRNGHSALTIATTNNYIKTVKLLIENSADINMQTKDGLTALMVSIINKNFKLFKYLIANGADVTLKEKRGLSAFEFAVFLNQTEMVEILIEKLDQNVQNIQFKDYKIIDFVFDKAQMRVVLFRYGCRLSNLNKKQQKHIKRIRKAIFSYKHIQKVKKKENKIMFGPLEMFLIKVGCTDYIKEAIRNGLDVHKIYDDGKTLYDYVLEAPNPDEMIVLLNSAEELKKTDYHPNRVVEMLSNFTKDTPVKYTTHLWDFGDVAKEYGGFDGFLDEVDRYFEDNMSDLERLTPHLVEKIKHYLSIWRECDGLKKWCDEGNDPFDYRYEKDDYERFGEFIRAFKEQIEIRSESDMLEEIFIEIEESLQDKEIEMRGLKGKKFYTDTEYFKEALRKIFHEIEKREGDEIVVKATDTTGEYIDITIEHIGSFAVCSAEEMLKEVEDGDFADIKAKLTNLCDWSVENSFKGGSYRVNYLRSDATIAQIEELDEKVRGFCHRMRFYR